jgi:tryptophan-rich sensory protein
MFEAARSSQPPLPRGRDLTGLAGWILLSQAAGVMGALFPPGDWYLGLARPAWNPPSWLFAPVWISLYTMMGVAAWLVWRLPRERRSGLGLFLLQLALNALWTPLFFGARLPGWAFLEIVLLWLAILATLTSFARVRRAAAWLLAPYLLWVTFAAALNFELWRLNR